MLSEHEDPDVQHRRWITTSYRPQRADSVTSCVGRCLIAGLMIVAGHAAAEAALAGLAAFAGTLVTSNKIIR